MDYDHPGRATISIALMRRAASNASRRIGSLFLMPGGPGNPGWRLSQTRSNAFQPEVLERFDLVGFDPRGVGRSTPVRCFKTNEQANEVNDRMDYMPVTKPQIDGTITAYADYSDACARNAGELLKHMSTADAARDLDVLRRAVGDKQLNLVTFTSGSLVGATYVNLFPRTVRALIFDASVDPMTRLNDGLQYDRERAVGWEYGLDVFLKLCKTEASKCAFSDGDPRAKFDEMRDHIRKEPVTLPDSTVVTETDLVDGIVGNGLLATTQTELAVNLQAIYNVVHPSPAAASVDMSLSLTPTKSGKNVPVEGTPYDSDDAYQAINCTDKPYPGLTPEHIPAIATKWEQESRTFGRTFAFHDPLACSTWPVKDPNPYRGPWDQATDNPVLLFGNLYDPNVSYESSRRMADQLANARLVGVNSFGARALGLSTCADNLATKYLISLRAPKSGEVCQPNVQPF
jgi:pimeloyl-ACP methyl ester carboxylesterase